jgi:lipid-A-disaccharide synthase
VDVPHVAMANLIAGRRAVAELIQSDFTAENLVSHLKPLLHDEAARDKMQTSLRQISAMLKAKGESRSESGETAIERAADFAAQMLHPKKSHLKESPQVL